MLLQTLHRTVSTAALIAGDPSPVINWDFLQSQSLTSFSRTSNATLFDSTGKLTYAANNLLLRSQEFQTTWTRQGVEAFGSGSTVDATIAPDGTTTADLFKSTAGSDRHQIRQGFAGAIGQRFVASVYVKAGTSSFPHLSVYDGGATWATAIFDLSSASTTASQTLSQQTTIFGTLRQPVGNDWHRISIAFLWNTTNPPNFSIGFAAGATGNTSADNSGIPTFTGTGSETLYFWGAQAEAVTYQTTPSTYNPTTTAPYYSPRYPYAYNGTTWDAQGLLVEAAGTNLATYSESFASGWTPYGNLNKTTDTTLAPNGVTLATKLYVTSSGSAAHELYTGTLSVGTGAYTHSIYAKAGTTPYVFIELAASGSVWAIAVFDLSNSSTTAASETGVSGGAGITGTSKVAVGNGWYRISISATYASASIAVVQVGIIGAATGNSFSADPAFNATGSETLYIWGAQVETGSTATSYIPNLSTGTTTRNADTSLAFSAISLPTGLSFSRASNAMQYDAAGSLTYAPNNLLTQSNTFSNSDWAWLVTPVIVSTNNTDPLGGSTATRTTIAAAPQYLRHTNVTGLGQGASILVSVWVKQAPTSSATSIRLTTNDTVAWSTGFSTKVTLSSSWQQISGVFTVGSSGALRVIIGAFNEGGSEDTSCYGDVLVYGATASLVTYETVARPCDQVITTTSAYYGPRYDYDPLTRLPKGLLIEEGRTNLSPASLLTNASWIVSGTNISRYAITTGPDGISNSAQTFQASSGSSYHFTYQTATISISSGSNYTYSVYAKAGTTRYVHINFMSVSQVYVSAVFDVGANNTSATQTAVGSTSGTIVSTSQQYVGNGWYRISLTGSIAASTTYIEMGIAGAATGNTIFQYGEATFSANGTETVSFYGAQLEAGSFPTSYIPTPGIASGIRSADVATLTGTALTTLQGSAGSAITETSNWCSNNAVIISDASYNLFLSNNSGISGNTIVGGPQSKVVTLGSGSLVGNQRQAIGWSASGYSLTASGASVNTGTALTTPGTMYLGSNGSATFFNGYARKFAAWNVKLADAKLQQKSVVGATL